MPAITVGGPGTVDWSGQHCTAAVQPSSEVAVMSLPAHLSFTRSGHTKSKPLLDTKHTATCLRSVVLCVSGTCCPNQRTSDQFSGNVDLMYYSLKGTEGEN